MAGTTTASTTVSNTRRDRARRCSRLALLARSAVTQNVTVRSVLTVRPLQVAGMGAAVAGARSALAVFVRMLGT
jgi:hypothetical protein